MDQLLAEIEQLKEEVELLAGRGNFSEADKKKEELARKYTELEAMKIQVSNQAIVADVTVSDQPYILVVDGDSVNFREWITDEGGYQVVTIGVRKKLYELEYQIESINKLFEQERQQYRDQILAADTAADAKYDDLYGQYHDLKNESDDKDRRLQAAADEIDTLKRQLATATTKPETTVGTNMENDLSEMMKKAREAKRAIYNVVNDSANINYTAQYVDTDETFTDKVIYIGKYRQLSNEEAERFQQEIIEANQNIVESVQEASATSDELDFRPETPEAPEVPTAEIPEHTANGEMDATPSEDAVTRAEFEALKTRVDILFQNQDTTDQKAAA